ncbi:iron chaperone [Caldibacillus lycopersici]|uniref:Iron chaperone n=1 Tax=Perspicuibacillus lycopersici TaxID=1325689 RepID=A0AAE3IQF5_9BACI|nr:iron chaperone [Perspicuibacillus lycopersici]MCU9612695.1 iron chaperone [Perspicuibacillus lycopersici]
MEIFGKFIGQIDNQQHRARTEAVLGWVAKEFPNLMPIIKWNQPMFTDHGTYIIGFSVSKHHLAVAPELAGINYFSEQIMASGYEHSKQLIRMPWDRPVDYDLLKKIIEFNMMDKAECTTFWRK